MKKLDKVLSIALIALMLSCVALNVFAAIDVGDIKADKDLGAGDTKMKEIGSFILTIVTNAAMILAVVVIAILGVKYMMGSAEEKAEYKKTLIPYFIGAILVFGAGAIGAFVVQTGKSLVA